MMLPTDGAAPGATTTPKQRQRRPCRGVFSVFAPSLYLAAGCFSAVLTSGQAHTRQLAGPAAECDRYQVVFDPAEGACVLEQAAEEPAAVSIAGIFDTTSFDWGQDIFEFTMGLITSGNVHTVWPEEVSAWLDSDNRAQERNSSTRFTYDVVDAGCDEATATRAYWDLRMGNHGLPPHGIIGARCSSASIALARIAGLENVPQLSPSSTSAALSAPGQFPFFSRVVAPDTDQGEVGAIVAMLRHFGWRRVSVVSVDEQFAKDLTVEFRKLWESETVGGEVGYSNVVRLRRDGAVDEDSVKQVLQDAPTNDPKTNSRIIVLAALSEHAFPIVKIAEETELLQPDTIWVSGSTFAARLPPSALGDSWVPRHPGYLGVGPFRNEKSPVRQQFLTSLQAWQSQKQRATILSDLPTFAAQMADSIVTMAMALKENLLDIRNGRAIVQSLRSYDFEGVSGAVRFTADGHLADPEFSIFQLQNNDKNNGGTPEWEEVGSTGIYVGSGNILIDRLCFPVLGCDLQAVPSDRYPVPRERLPGWAVGVLVAFVVVSVVVTFKYWRSWRSKQQIKNELESFRGSVVGMRTAKSHYLPRLSSASGGDAHSGGDIEEQATPSNKKKAKTTPKITWCWRETIHVMGQHPPENIVGDPADCWIKYDKSANNELEKAFKAQKGKGTHSPLPGYIVDFKSMTQTKNATGFQREVLRVENDDTEDTDAAAEGLHVISAKDTIFGDALPADIADEPQMVLVMGDIIQISKQRPDGWAFGTKLYHADETIARTLVEHVARQQQQHGGGTALSGASDSSDINVFPDTGWFCLDATEVPTTEDLAALQRNVGDAGTLEKPPHWGTVKDASKVELCPLQEDSNEYKSVVKDFMSTMGNRNVKIDRVDRIQNLAMWQSYVVKRQTICNRETQTGKNGASSASSGANLTGRFERKYLWHGTNAEVKDKILQQGFNRSFCGKNATMYGKGVYFARDASYSSYKTYAVPDSKGYQYIMACRVVVGEYCVGKQNAITPDLRDAKNHILFDSTVGLLTGDTMARPSIYVTYHDSQAYPEYLIRFKQP